MMKLHYQNICNSFPVLEFSTQFRINISAVAVILDTSIKGPDCCI